MNLYEPTKRILTLSLLAAAASLAGIALIAWVVFTKISMINTESQKTQQMNVSVEQAFKIKGQLNALDSELKTLDSFFVGADEEVKFIESIESIASTSKVKLDIQSISVDSKNSQGFKDDMQIKLQADGGKENLLSFLKNLENAPKILTVNTADLSQAETGWVLRLEILVYRLR